MAKDKQLPMVDLEEGSQGTNAIFNEPKLISDQKQEPINGTETSRVNFTLVKAMNVSDEPGTFSQVPFLWPSSVNHNYCCIYRVPCRLRRVNPEAYTPQMLLIGPLHHSKKAQASVLCNTDLRYLDYLKMEQHKRKYLKNFARLYGNQTVEEFKKIISRDEQIIRACYAESTDPIDSHDFVEMMLHDSVFILVFFIQLRPDRYIDKTGDFLFDEPGYQYTIFEDLILLENQLPFTLLENLFESFFIKSLNVTFRDFIIGVFHFKENIKAEVKFLHFTDLIRRARVETLGLTEDELSNAKFVRRNMLTSLPNADKLDSAGVKFVGVEKDSRISLVIKFEGRILQMPSFTAEDETERKLRNIMALEQCHYSYTTFVCDYIVFLDFLIDTVKDVDFLVNKGIIENWLGSPESVAEMVNKLCLGVVDFGSYYYDIAESLKNHLESPLYRICDKSFATLRRVYFKDFWTGTAHIAAVVILALTLIGTVASVLQVTQNDNNPTK